MNAIRLLFVLLFAATPIAAHAQNCSNIKSGFGVNQKPQNASRDIIGKSLDDIIERGWIRFAVYDDHPPYSYKKDGKPAGVDVEIGQLIAKELGVEARYYFTGAEDNVDADLRNNIWKGALVGGQISNVMLRVPYNRELACRNEQVVLTGQYYNEKLAIAYRKSDYEDGGPTPAYFRYDTVGVENDSISDFYLSSIGNGSIIPKMTRFKSVEAAMKGLRDGKVMAVMGPIGQLEFGLNDEIAVHSPTLPGLALGEWTLGVAVRHTWRPLGYAVDDAIRAAVEDGRIEAIFAKHELSYAPPNW